jgi:hypothetical protein
MSLPDEPLPTYQYDIFPLTYALNNMKERNIVYESSSKSYAPWICFFIRELKKKLKSLPGAFSTPRPHGSIVLLPQQVTAFISRGATHHRIARDLYQRRRELLPILLADPEFTKYTRVFYMPQSWDMGYIILLPLIGHII